MANQRTQIGLSKIQLFTLFCCMGGFGCGNSDTPEVVVDAALIVPDAVVQPTPIVECQSRNGSRLQREILEANSEARQEFRIIDSMYDIPCSFRFKSGTEYSCEPTNANLGGTRYFLNSDCTGPLIAHVAETRPFHLTNTASADGCTSFREYLELGAPVNVAVGQQNIYRTVAGVCTTLVAPTGRTYYQASPVNFLSATLEPVSDTSRLSTYTYVGSDDSVMCSSLSTFQDTMLGQDCLLRNDVASSLRCLPVSLRRKTFKSDATCGTPIEVAEQSRCVSETPNYTYLNEGDSCGQTVQRVYEVNTTALPGVFLGEEINTCVSGGGDGSMYFRSETEALPTGFESLQEEEPVRAGDERMAKRRLVTPDKFAVFSGWYDTNQEVDCTYRLAADNTMRCLPNAVITNTNLFTDNMCTIPISVFPAPADGCGEAPRFFYVPISNGRQRIHAVETIPANTLFQAPMGGGCAIFEAESYKPSFEVSASTFQAGEISVQ